ncbi:MAG: undecaprenyldiphospho-muramoylpentapeptide beta-N-acetylglucosaminyltransferase [Desulfobacterales bacterium]|nr:undecaprenyldiphospho-muramoylpentapeptide beta-N-acetylglucosaminyltransferase [Desulfobacterales bacterium]MDD4071312.1 undecaprenyldiphospho-muramoylpentapeptide beta-N-acetylglucosaminyltransferase [Desulfobacterales bacterium]MDD4393004.1 undecaprenyldiphospho-muramoylpentapeptide beta-N-acetylglucosaminyltransferase [Desulfobacterales bacterium]
MNRQTLCGNRGVRGDKASPEGGSAIVIAGGGTGGHLFPGIAIAEAFREKDPGNRVLFVSTGRPLEVSALAGKRFDLRRISVKGLKGKGRLDQFLSAIKIPGAVLESIRILKQFKPAVVIGVGGYSSGPVALAAWLLGIRVVIHEQNIIAGMTNRILARLAYRICLSFDSIPRGINPEKAVITGNPVRKEFLETSGRIREPAAEKPFTVLIIGGSQGAHRINMTLLDALEHIEKKDRFFLIHQTGELDEDVVRKRYSALGMKGDVRAFFGDMASQYRKADLVICRAGATTVAEITAIGKPAVFIPFPYAADNHQELNARSLADRGAAELILETELTGELLAGRIRYFVSDPKALIRMASRVQTFARPDAARDILALSFSQKRLPAA